MQISTDTCGTRKRSPLAVTTYDVHFASGDGGDKFYIVTSLRLIGEITSSAYDFIYGQLRSQNILRKVLAASSLSKNLVRYRATEGHSTSAPQEGVRHRLGKGKALELGE
jgi:hypothetical protein